MPEQETPHDERRVEEVASAWLNRYNEAQDAGLSYEDAAAFADSGDVSELRKLVKKECPPELIRQIVL